MNPPAKILKNNTVELSGVYSYEHIKSIFNMMRETDSQNQNTFWDTVHKKNIGVFPKGGTELELVYTKHLHHHKIKVDLKDVSAALSSLLNWLCKVDAWQQETKRL